MSRRFIVILISEVDWPVIDIEELLSMRWRVHFSATRLWFLVAYKFRTESRFYLFRQYWYSRPLVSNVVSVEFVSGEHNLNARSDSLTLHELESICAG